MTDYDKGVEVIESPQERAALSTHVEVLDQVGTLQVIPNMDFATTTQVAEFYGVSSGALRSLVHLHRDEFKEAGHRTLDGSDLRLLRIASKELTEVPRQGSQLALFSRRAVLLAGMLLRDSVVAIQVRRYLLEVESKAVETVEFTPPASVGSISVPLDTFDRLITAPAKALAEATQALAAATQEVASLLREVKSQTSLEPPAKPISGDEKNRRIREWAKQAGYPVADRGALPHYIKRAYEARNTEPKSSKWHQVTPEELALALGRPLQLEDGRVLRCGVKRGAIWAGYLDPNKKLSAEWLPADEVRVGFSRVLSGTHTEAVA